MFRSLYVASTGMVAQETKLDTIANNLANANTVGFKRQDAQFEDLVYQNVRTPGRQADGGMGPTGVQVGLGTRVVTTPRHFTQGAMQQTGNQLDVAIEGNGFLPVVKPDGGIAYTRSGALSLNAQGQLVTQQGFPIEPSISIPTEATAVAISPEGNISVMLPGQSDPSEIGQLQLVTFPNPAGLNGLGKNLFEASASSGDPAAGAPAADGRGSILQGALESSNVEVVTEMIGMIRTQRAYEINSKVIEAADDMLRKASTIR